MLILETPPISYNHHLLEASDSMLDQSKDAFEVDLATEETSKSILKSTLTATSMTSIAASRSLYQDEHHHAATNDHQYQRNLSGSTKNGKNIKVFLNAGRRSLSKSSTSSTTKTRGGLKDFFHFSTPKKEPHSRRSSITSVSTNNSSIISSTQEQHLSTKQQLSSSVSSHDSQLFPLLPSPEKDTSNGQRVTPIDCTSNSTTLSQQAQDTATNSSINKKATPTTQKQQNRSSVQLLRSPTSNNTDIRMFHDRPLSLSIMPADQQQQQNDLPSPPPSATLSKTVPPFNSFGRRKNENSTAKDFTLHVDTERNRGRTQTCLNHSTQRRHGHHHLAHQRSLSPTVVSIQTEHAEPTFIRTTTTQTTATSNIPTPFKTVDSRSTHEDTHPYYPSSSSSSSTTTRTTTTGVTREHLLKVKSRQGLKSYRSDGDLGRFKSLFIPSTSTHSIGNNNESRLVDSTRIAPTKISSATSPSSLQNSNSLHSLSSVLRPLVPQRTSSTRMNHKSSYTNLREAQDTNHPAYSTTSNNKFNSSPWNLLRQIRKNSSATSLKKSASIQDNEHYTRYGPFAENTICNSSEGSVLHLSENHQDVLIMEMVGGRFQVVAGTCEKLFIKLADETTQDFSYVDAYILNHTDFTTSEEFLENLMARFHIEPQSGETDYFRKWQRCIQIKVLNIISRWINLQFWDFINNPVLLTRLQAFINGDIIRGGFMMEASNIKELLHSQVLQHGQKRFSNIQTQLHRHHQQNPSTMTSHPPMCLHSEELSPTSPLLSLNVKDMAQYLTLADFYLLKCITAYEYIHGNWRRQHKPRPNAPSHKYDPLSQHQNELDYIDLMTKRANMLGTWTKNEICSQQSPRDRSLALKRMIEIANLCLEWNNFHTSMIIVASLLQPCIQKLDGWSMVSSRDLHGYQQLVKLLDVSNNMGRYRQALGKATKSPTVPFFPLLLKDMTFFMDGNQTYLSSASPPSTTSSVSTASSSLSSSSSSSSSSTFSLVPSSTTELINFAKYRSLTRCVYGILRATSEDYYFATDLGPWPFLHHVTGNDKSSQTETDYLSPLSSAITTPLPLDRTAFLLEQSIRKTSNTQSNSSSSSSRSSSNSSSKSLENSTS
ncbi:ras guanine nucleotide exchange factor domain-containing protein [Absidia repens]|uniref:Ras guanine nucleotide exchange factor domain-containing protein n=1 Tax=Absidia repens TaxID=90262 RepID=A0A1X2I3Q8_9FUNG|nr:ras guanine nucleotide exchange factor domain-containing protein [Absidia repens]